MVVAHEAQKPYELILLFRHDAQKQCKSIGLLDVTLICIWIHMALGRMAQKHMNPQGFFDMRLENNMKTNIFFENFICWPMLSQLGPVWDDLEAMLVYVRYCFPECSTSILKIKSKWLPTLAKMAHDAYKLVPSWVQVGQVGPILGLCWPMLAHLGTMLR